MNTLHCEGWRRDRWIGTCVFLVGPCLIMEYGAAMATMCSPQHFWAIPEEFTEAGSTWCATV